LKPERSGSPLVHEKYQEEKACDKRHPYNNNNNNNGGRMILTPYQKDSMRGADMYFFINRKSHLLT